MLFDCQRTNSDLSDSTCIDATARRKNTRQNSHPPSETGSDTPTCNYGTINSPYIGGASTPKRRPSGPHRLGSVNTTALVFDKVKMKGVKAAQRSEAMQAVIQNLEAMGNTVEVVNADGTAKGVNGNGNGNGNDESSSNHEGDADSQNDGSESGQAESHVEVTVEHPNGHQEELIVNMEDNENTPLLGGKQLASSPGRM